MRRYWVQLEANTEKIQRSLLKRGRTGDFVEGWRAGQLRLDPVFGDRGQVAEQGLKAVHGLPLFGALVVSLAQGPRRALRRRHHRIAKLPAGLWILVVEEHRS